jgi:hypothetical protein
MWMISPKLLCRRHLLGEHNEIHKFRSIFEKGTPISKRIELDQIEPESMERRHTELAAEMERRGYHHNSPYKQPSLEKYSKEEREHRVNQERSYELLLNRCEECRKRATLR